MRGQGERVPYLERAALCAELGALTVVLCLNADQTLGSLGIRREEEKKETDAESKVRICVF